MSDSRIFDLDIDIPSGVDKEKYGIRGMVYNAETEKVIPHPSAYYIENVPVDPLTGVSAFDYEYGDKEGFLKLDLLTNTSYDIFSSKEEVIQCMNIEPDWSKLQDKDFVSSLPHLANHYDDLIRISPHSVDELSDFLALIRPGKRHLFDQYIKNPESVRRQLYKRSSNDLVYFKKSHAISYACMIVCVMNKKNQSGLFGF